ncbi:uncharacterized protein LOC115631253 [Scaptodrosophila lebanonensis]|uniref:Uncharacterized protein LOC115631253 n=1 Tax=Drosophila lebanonensis TaxID=7225 RepID=A0A6J2U785_DROLE|nr:uncharacterized protein LOC115631253 [Scaptodrosophila lebanonensis]
MFSVLDASKPAAYYWAIHSDTIVTTEFKLLHIMRGIGFRKKILQFTRCNDVCGYIIYTHNGRRAYGEMEGTIGNINKVRDWILTQCVPEPFMERVSFSPFVRERYPRRLKFSVAYQVPVRETSTSEIELH